MTGDMAMSAVSARLRDVGRLSDLRVDRRLDTKVDMRSSSVTRRLRTVGSLTSLCLRLGRRSAPGRSTAKEELRRLRGEVAQLAGLLAEERETLGDLTDGGAGAEHAALAEIRAETAALADSIRSGLLATPRVLRNLELHYACILGQQSRIHGFPWTSDVCEVAREIARHAGPRPRPTMLVGPRSFPLASLAGIALSGKPIPWPAPGTLQGADSTPQVRPIEPTELLRDRLVDDSPVPTSAAFGARVVSGFWAVDSGVQRDLCDRAVWLGIPLVVIAPCDPAGPGERDFAGYALPALEIGVSDRLFKIAVPLPRRMDEGSVREWLLDRSCWREGLLPLAQLAAGWGG